MTTGRYIEPPGGRAGESSTFDLEPGGWLVVPDGGERAFLAPRPVHLLELSPVVAGALGRWGIGTIGALAELPRSDVILRLGSEGEALHRLACGDDGRAFIPDRPVASVREGACFDDAIGALEPFLFVLNGVLGRLARRLELRGEGFSEVRLELTLDGGERYQTVVRLVAPTREVTAVLPLVRLRLEASPPGAPVESVSVVVQPGTVRLLQGHLFGPPSPSPGKLAAALVRLAALVGPERVGAPAVADTHEPGRYVVLPFAPGPWEAGSGGREQKRGSTAGEVGWGPGSGVRGPEEEPEDRERERGAAVCPGDWGPGSGVRGPEETGIGDRRGGRAGGLSALGSRPGGVGGWSVVRAVRPPLPAHVVVAGRRPVVVQVGRLGGTVVALAGPYRTTGNWWGESPFSRDDYDVALADGSLLRLSFDRLAKTWAVDGVYD